MAWNDGEDVSTGQIITAARWNNYMGASGSLMYLKTEADKLDDISAVDQTSSRAIDGTVYQNTGGKIRIVAVSARFHTDASDGDLLGRSYILAECDASTPPSQDVDCAGINCYLHGLSVTNNYMQGWGTVIFAVNPSYYYKVTETHDNDGLAPVLQKWLEWDVH